MAANLIQVDQRKWPDLEHYQFEVRLLGRDDHGKWVHAPPGTVVRRGEDEPWALHGGFVGLVPEDKWWVVEFYPDHPEITVYGNIGTPPEWNGSRVTQGDLDLDLVRHLDGTVEIIDEYEFEEHRLAYGYPEELVDGAREAAEQAASLMREGVEPFGISAEKWLSQVDPGKSPTTE